MSKKPSLMALLFALCVLPVMSQDAAKPAAAPPVAAAPAGSTGSPQAAKSAPKAVKASPANDEAGIQALFQGLTEAWTAGDAKLAASHWLKDGSLISPMGTAAWNRDEVEKIAGSDIQHFGGTNTFSDLKIVPILPGGFALVDATATISGLKNADGTAAPDFVHHVYAAVVNRGGKWYFKALRPYLFVQPPTAAAVAPAASTDAAPPAAPADDAKGSKKKDDAKK